MKLPVNVSTRRIVEHLNALNVKWHDEIDDRSWQILVEVVQCVFEILNEIVSVVFDSILARIACIVATDEYGD